MDNLDLPNLRELLLHRNCITSISGLQKCTRVKKLWLFQNKITKISGLQALPELEECWIQANEITSLSGLEYNSALCRYVKCSFVVLHKGCLFCQCNYVSP